MPESLFPKHGGYRKLRSFLAAQAAYDATIVFCERFVDRRSRTRDQMVQAARSGVQFRLRGECPHIAAGSLASGTSKKTELKLTSVARASLEELLLDCEDFLRQRGLKRWAKDDPRALAVRGRYRAGGSDRPDESDGSDKSDPYGLKTADAETATNRLICLVNQASRLLGRQLRTLEQAFLDEGGFTERLYRARSERRGR